MTDFYLEAQQLNTQFIQVEEAINQGARLICGGMPTVDQDGKGRFFEPTVVANAENDMVFMVWILFFFICK